MVPSDIRLDDLSRSWIRYVRTICILDIRSKVSDDRISRIFWTPIWIFFFARRIFGNDSIFEARHFKGSLPIFYPLLQVRHPLTWCSWIDIEYNRLLWFYQFTSSVFVIVFFFDFQSPSVKESSWSSFLLIKSIVHYRSAEPAHSPISKTLHHRFFWKQYHRRVHLYSDQACARIWRGLSSGISHHVACLDIHWIRTDSFDVWSVCIQSRNFKFCSSISRESDRLYILSK